MDEREPQREDKQPEGPSDPLSEGVDAVMDVVGNVVSSVDAAIGALFVSGPEHDEKERRRRELSSLFGERGRDNGRSR